MSDLTVDVLVATVNREDDEFLEYMNISGHCVVINQCFKIDNCHFKPSAANVEWHNVYEKGISRSRNKALEKSKADVCILTDDDVRFTDDYEKIVATAHEEYPEADIIAFIVERTGTKRLKKFRKKRTWNKYLGTMKISSVEITLKRKSIMDAGLKFNPFLGTGEQFFCGEESTFLFDAVRSKLKILYLPLKIAETNTDDSTWFKGYDEKYLHSMGAAYYNMSKRWYRFLAMQFAVRHKNLFKQYSFFEAYKYLIEGAKLYKEMHE